MLRMNPAFDVPEYQGTVRQDLILAAKTNSNLSGMMSEDNSYLAKDLQATSDFLMPHNAGAAFFLLDELKRLG